MENYNYLDDYSRGYADGTENGTKKVYDAIATWNNIEHQNANHCALCTLIRANVRPKKKGNWKIKTAIISIGMLISLMIGHYIGSGYQYITP